jgi:hypothetical protein
MNFAAYPLFYVDAGLSLLGIQSPALDLAVDQIEAASGDVGPAGNVDAGPDAVAASQADQLAMIEGALQASLPAPIIPPGTLPDIPAWVWWALGGVGALAALAILAPYVGLVEGRR